MLNLSCDKRGISIIEVLVAMLLTAVASISILTLQSSALRTAGRSDYLGRAAGLLYSELERTEVFIMSKTPTTMGDITAGTTATDVLVSGLAAGVDGDASYRVSTTIASIGTVDMPAWRVTVTVTWPPVNTMGITENIVVTLQDRYK